MGTSSSAHPIGATALESSRTTALEPLSNCPPQSIPVFIDCADPLRRYAFNELLSILGWAPYSTDIRSAALYYGPNPNAAPEAAVRVPLQSSLDSLATGIRFCVIRGIRAPYVAAPAQVIWHQQTRLSFDLFRAAAYWLTLEHEFAISQRDDHGRVPATASPLHPHERLEEPPLHSYANLLAAGLRRIMPGFTAAPRWPGGRQYAVAFTHDVDDPERPDLLPNLLHQLGQLVGRRRREAYWQLRADLRSGHYLDLLKSPTRRPQWDFHDFMQTEARFNVRSAFYFAVERRALRLPGRAGNAIGTRIDDAADPLDVAYDCRHARFRRLFRELHSQHWELGLHAGYRSRDDRTSVRRQRRRLQALADAPFTGVRHHYLRLHPGNPLQTLADDAAAGLEYDSSIGFNDAPGFRAGIALPFRPYDPLARAAGGLIELPLTIADMHLSRTDKWAAIDATLEHLQAIRRLGGLAVLDWHVGHWHSDPAWRAAYFAACQFVAEDSEAWAASPAEIARWWRRRSLAATPRGTAFSA